MRDKRVKLVFFSLRGSEVRDFSISWQKILLFSVMLVIFLIILVGAVVGLISNFYQNSRITTLQKTNQILKNQLGEMRERIDAVAAQIEKIEHFDDEQRLIAGLDIIAKDMRNAGRGGPSLASFVGDFSVLPDHTRDELTNIRIQVDQLEKRVELAKESQQEIAEIFKQKKEWVEHLPTINPVRNGRITDTFGYRIDPFIEKPKMHTGLDIAAPVNTPVYAAAAGYVESVHHSYSPNASYGKYVVIDHGFGKKTVYGHLSKIFVKPGQQVKRWDIIGAVGETGRATGPHLHYEVRINDDPVDPAKYFFE
ncbi:MAG: M23 family metallopeptidase [candidate division KSB1 bacterium]|nr:M23 family metallopeptidase [candidate division KSB1 bacterium]MDZ7356955.1 M23 family metallopeptidase [candidate division KSB1 bacterium]MDZ7400090.1 M23 family metallopeptidase [candidate division KSB1 bacterium]